ncbi:acyltransferase [Flavihumibacter sediminis]|nr:acyltransferase [Flavihumibacter sediminis]
MVENLSYVKSLNTVRAFAVAFVMFQHWLPLSHHLQNLQLGSLGVDIFFTLSGFLITGILLSKLTGNNGILSRLSMLNYRNFIVRRALRIIPAYSLALFLTWLLSSYLIPFDQSAWKWLITLTTNWHIIQLEYWPGTIVHFWSLAVEEQYYLFWPLLLFFFKGRSFPFLALIMITLAVWVRYHARHHNIFDVSTLACLDSFAMGGLFAWYRNQNSRNEITPISYLPWLALLLFLLVSWGNYLSIDFFINQRRLLGSFVGILLIVFLVSRNDYNKTNSFFWENPFLLQVGQISYGIYLFHLLVPDIPGIHWVVGALVKAVIVFGFSWLSWNYFEKPILTYKKYFS